MYIAIIVIGETRHIVRKVRVHVIRSRNLHSRHLGKGIMDVWRNVGLYFSCMCIYVLIFIMTYTHLLTLSLLLFLSDIHISIYFCHSFGAESEVGVGTNEFY